MARNSFNNIPKQVSLTMKAVKGKGTKIELMVRKALFKRGFRYRINFKQLPGSPDIVLPKYHAVIMVNGCFWHGHRCHIFKMPKTRTQYWSGKIIKNQRRDRLVELKLQFLGWKVLTVWECALIGKDKRPFEEVIDVIDSWLLSGESSKEICGKSVDCL